MYLETPSHAYVHALAANSTATAYSTTYVYTSEPTGDGIFFTGGFNQAVVQPYGVGADNATGGIRVLGLRRINTTGTVNNWVATPVAQATTVLCSATGVSGAAIGTTSRFADAVTLTLGPASTGGLTGTTDVPGHLVIDLEGFTKFKVEPIVTTATSANALVALI